MLRLVSSDRLLESLRAAVEAVPEDVELRLHYAQLLDQSGQRDEAVRQAAAVLQREPSNVAALALVTGDGSGLGSHASPNRAHSPQAAADPPPPGQDVLQRLDEELRDVVPPMFAEPAGEVDVPFDLDRTPLRLADVGGMREVKARLEASVLAPLRNPELGRLYRKSVRGGLLLYGPPGCGKTFIARAVAGELDARFLAVSLADVLDMFIGQSERNVHELFEYARRNAPCVIFFDEVDAIGQKRSQRAYSATRGSINQLLTEMDGIAEDNGGVFVLGATNHPWDVDVALRRPGRFDRMLLVLPPDQDAREAILRYHLRDRPIASIDVKKLARASDGYSGADLAYACEVAAERALLDSAATNTVRMIEMQDLFAALSEVKPSTGPWFDTARNVAQFANEDGSYDELAAYLRRHRLM
jgi:SpoVK/Ycf46/Vps4 family AAA+-type ATPase